MKRALAETHFLKEAQAQILKCHCFMQVSTDEIATLSDEDLALIATAEDNNYPDEIVLATWEELAARGLVVDFIEQPPLPRQTSDDLLTVATFRNYVQAQLAQTRLLASGISAFLFDDNMIRINWLWATALGFVKLRVSSIDTVEALQILGLVPDEDIPERCRRHRYNT